MFRNTLPSPLADTDVIAHPTEPVPLSVLALDLPAPAVGWHGFLAGRGIAVLLDDLGRDSISRDDARQLILEKQEHESRAHEMARRQEQQAVEADRAFRAALPTGLHWTDIPVGVSAPELWAQAERDAKPKRRTVLQDALEGGGSLVYHQLRDEADES